MPSGYALNDPVFNANGGNENVLKAAITAGLYANVVKIEKKVKFHRTIEGGSFESTPLAKEYRMYIRREVPGGEVQHGLTRVFIHPSSINFVEQEYKCPYLVYVGLLGVTED